MHYPIPRCHQLKCLCQMCKWLPDLHLFSLKWLQILCFLIFTFSFSFMTSAPWAILFYITFLRYNLYFYPHFVHSFPLSFYLVLLQSYSSFTSQWLLQIRIILFIFVIKWLRISFWLLYLEDSEPIMSLICIAIANKPYYSKVFNPYCILELSFPSSGLNDHTSDFLTFL